MARGIGALRGVYKIQVGAFGVQGNAERLSQLLGSEGFGSRIVYREGLWKVYGGDSLSRAN